MSDVNIKTTKRYARYRLTAGMCSALLVFSCGKKQPGAAKSKKTTIQVKGSDTMVNVAQAWAEEYKKVRPDVDVEVSGGARE